MGNWKIVVPEATTNLITNPSFEADDDGDTPTGWSTDGTNSIHVNLNQSIFGPKAMRCTYGNDLDLARYTITLTAAAHAFSAWVWPNTNWDGGAIQLAIENFTSATTDTATTTTTTIGEWTRLEILFTPDAGDLTGDLVIEAASAPSGSQRVWVDGAQCEALGYTTTYIDGDQEGGKWTSTAHASTSTRDALSRAGGRVKDFEDDYSFPVRRLIGLGAAQVDNVLTNRIYTPGANYQRTTVPARRFSLVTRMQGSSLSDYHDKRQALFNVLAPDAFDSEPVILRYTGASVDKQIRARYDGGLNMTGITGRTERVALQFIADDPYFTQIGETGGGAVDTDDSATYRYVAGRVDGAWDVLGPPDAAGTYSAIRSIAVGNDGTVYFGGDFTNFDNIANADYIVSWDGSSYSALGTGMDGVVYKLVIKANGNLLAGGDFTTAGGTTVRGIAEWDGSSWSALGPPSAGGGVRGVAVAPDATVYVTGTFTNWDGIATADYIASWDGSSWSALSGGADNDVTSIAVASNGDLYFAGIFNTVGGTTADGIAKYDGSTFTDLSPDGTGDPGYVFIDSNDTLYAHGSFTSINGVTASRIASYNGVEWSPLGVSLNAAVNSLVEWRGFLVLGGQFTNAANDHMALWNGSTYTSMDIDLPGTPNIWALAERDDNLYVGYTTTGTGNYAGTTSLTPGGNARVYPVITVDRSGGTTATVANIINETTKTHLWLDYDLQDGEKITIDLRPGIQTVTSDYRGAVTPILQGSDESQFYLLPNVANDIKALVATTGSPTVASTIKWVESYWGVD